MSFWILQKQDFECLPETCPQFTRAVGIYIKQNAVSGYLTMKQYFDANQAAQWTHKAVKRMKSGKADYKPVPTYLRFIINGI